MLSLIRAPNSQTLARHGRDRPAQRGFGPAIVESRGLVAVFASAGRPQDWEAERQEWLRREQFLVNEVAAARSQVDRLLEQQQQLLTMLAAAAGLPLTAPTATAPGSSSPAVRAAAAVAAAAAAAEAAAPEPAMRSAAAVAAAAAAAAEAASPPPSPSTPRQLAPSATAASSMPTSATASSSATSSTTSGGDPAMIALFKEWGVITSPPSESVDAIRSAMQAVDAADVLQDREPPFGDSYYDDVEAGLSGAQEPTMRLPVPLSVIEEQSGAASGESSSTDKTKPAVNGYPPSLMTGDDDIYWMNRLHVALLARGYFPGDDDMQEWFFGENTLLAVQAFQASAQLPETGLVDKATWAALLADLPKLESDIAQDIAAGKMRCIWDEEAAQEQQEQQQRQRQAEPAPGPVAAAAAIASSRTVSGSEIIEEGAEQLGPANPSGKAVVEDDAEEVVAVAESAGSASSSGAARSTASPGKWPVLMDGDGGKEVHSLQGFLGAAGFYCGEDEMQWWMFGDSTLNALKTFQACNGLAESGVCDERTWRALLGSDAQPGDVLARVAADAAPVGEGGEGAAYDDDLTEGIQDGKRVWLLGEQRWERRA